MTLLVLFRTELLAAIDSYEQLFSEKKCMSLARSRNVIDLKAMINDEDYDACELKDTIQQYLIMLNTGWWIFKTGRSRLKNYLYRVMSDSRFSDRGFLREQQRILQQQQELEARLLARLRLDSEFLAASEEDKDAMIRAMAFKIEQYEYEQGEATVTINTLRQQCSNLHKSNLSLYQKVRALLAEQVNRRKTSESQGQTLSRLSICVNRQSDWTCSSGSQYSFTDLASVGELSDGDDDSPSNSVYGSLQGMPMTLFPG